MLTLPVYDQSGKSKREAQLDKNVFGLELNPSLIKQAVLSELASRRRSTAHVKTRGEVRGGGKKPWRQKGTGRARHGSIRSPLWRGGGKTFGPRNIRTYHLKMNKKAKRKALLMALSEQVRNKRVILLDKLVLSAPKTKELKKIFAHLPIQREVLVILPKKDEKILRASRNAEAIKTALVNSLLVYDVLSAHTLLMLEESAKIIERTYGQHTPLSK